jgi:Xaa-Pro aminopeptidase
MQTVTRRQQVAELLGDGVLILSTAPEVTRNHDAHYDFRPDSDFLWLTGFEEPEAIAVLAPGHATPYVLFVRPRDPEREVWDGRRAGPEGAIRDFGADHAFPIDEFPARIADFLQNRSAMWWGLGRFPDRDAQLLAAMNGLRETRRQPERAPAALRDPRRLLHPLRMIKSDDELATMREAARITAEAHHLAMRTARPGMKESAVRGILEGHFLQRGCRAPAYGSIIAGGANACILHYVDNRDTLREGDLVLIDAGGELDWYAADITRTWPVGRRFSPAQRDVYQAVLQAQRDACAAARPGISQQTLQQQATRTLTQALVDFGVLHGDIDGLIEQQAHRRYYMHGLGHYLGLDVHDVGTYLTATGEGIPLTPGMVITVEPGLYIPADDEAAPEAFRGIGVRIEDDLVITPGEAENLTAQVPTCPDDIEALRTQALDG